MAQEREEKGNSGKKKSNSKKQAKIENDDDDEPEALDLNTHIDQQTNYFEKMLKTKAGAAAAALDADDGSIRKLGVCIKYIVESGIITVLINCYNPILVWLFTIIRPIIIT